MGFESFRVELRGGPATHTQADEAVRRLPHAKPDPGALATAGSAYYTLEDGSHVIEVEVAEQPVRASFRFTLCHPPSVDAAFLSVVGELMATLGMDAFVCDDIPAEQIGPYSVGRFAEFAAVVTRAVAARRAEWVATFGPAQFAATTPGVYEKVILPRCEPVAG